MSITVTRLGRWRVLRSSVCTRVTSPALLSAHEMTSRAATKNPGMEPPQNHVGRSMMTALGTWELTAQT